MRLLLAIHNAYTDHTSGAAHSMRILMQWLREAGHDVSVLCTARFDAKPPSNILNHLSEHGLDVRRTAPPKAFARSSRRSQNLGPGRPRLDFTLHDVPVTMLWTNGRPNTPADRFEADQFLFMLSQQFEGARPDVLLTYGGHPLVYEVMRLARERGIRTIFTLRNYGYEDRRCFEHVDHVFTTSPYLTEFYRERIGLRSIGIDSPIDWSEVEAPEELRRFVTFVNPSLAKGAMVFARLADTLGSRRPDIPLLVVQSASSAGKLNAIPGLDFRKYPQIMAAPATPRPADFFALTRLLLVPSVFAEPFGRVAAESLINGIPVLVSNRGALPQTVEEGGVVVPLPDWITPDSRELPSEEDVRPWLETICDLWDHDDRYEAASARARATAARRYDEAIMRAKYLEYFESLDAAEPLFD
jgi:glycosyltransferase involved in cell wall biosynthesis